MFWILPISCLFPDLWACKHSVGLQGQGIALMGQSCKVGARNLMIHGLRVVCRGKPERPEKSSSVPKKTSKVSNPRGELKAANQIDKRLVVTYHFLLWLCCVINNPKLNSCNNKLSFLHLSVRWFVALLGLVGLGWACLDLGTRIWVHMEQANWAVISQSLWSWPSRGGQKRKQKQMMLLFRICICQERKQKHIILLRTCTCHFLQMAQSRVNGWGRPQGEQEGKEELWGRKNCEQVTHSTTIVGKKKFIGKCKEGGGLTFQDIEMQMREHQ